MTDKTKITTMANMTATTATTATINVASITTMITMTTMTLTMATMRKLYQLFATAQLGTFVRIWTKSGFPHPFGQFEHFLACMGYGWAWTRDVKNASRLRLKRSNNRVDTTELNTKVP